MTYKLSFNTKKAWGQLLDSMLIDGQLPSYISGYYVLGFIPIPATYDEDGNELTPASKHKDYAVDVYTTIEVEKFKEFEITNEPKTWSNVVAGFDK